MEDLFFVRYSEARYMAAQSALQRLFLPVTRSCRNRAGESAPCNTLKSTSSSGVSLPRDSRPNFRKSRDPSSKWPLEEPVATNFRSLRPTLFEDTWDTRREEKSSRYLTLSPVVLSRHGFVSRRSRRDAAYLPRLRFV